MGFTESSLERLIVNLKKLRDETDVAEYLVDVEGLRYLSVESIEHTDGVPGNLKKLIVEIMFDLNEWLIADNGWHHQPNREILNRHGFRFVKGREDAHGIIDAIIVVGDYAIIYK